MTFLLNKKQLFFGNYILIIRMLFIIKMCKSYGIKKLFSFLIKHIKITVRYYLYGNSYLNTYEKITGFSCTVKTAFHCSEAMFSGKTGVVVPNLYH